MHFSLTSPTSERDCVTGVLTKRFAHIKLNAVFVKGSCGADTWRASLRLSGRSCFSVGIRVKSREDYSVAVAEAAVCRVSVVPLVQEETIFA